MSRSRWFFLIAVLLAACTGEPEAEPTPTTAPVAEPVEDDEFVFGLILVGPQDDQGWSEAHFRGAQYVERNLPDSRFVVLDRLNPDVRPDLTLVEVVDRMVAEGAELIFITSDDFAADTILAAEAYPDVAFVHISGDHVLRGDAPPNLANYMVRMTEGKMIAGCAAGLATQTYHIGYLGPLINAETRRLANSAYLGARYCLETFRNQDPIILRFDVEWIGFWFHIPGVTQDPTEVAQQMIDSGVDVVMSGIDTTEAVQVVAERAESGADVWVVPYDYFGACEGAPGECLGVPYYNWGPGYLELAEAVRDGAFESEWTWEAADWDSLNEPDGSGVGYIKGGGLTETQAEQLDTFISGLADGSIVLFEGPLELQDGSTYVEAGELASDEEIWYMPQLLNGMEGASE